MKLNSILTIVTVALGIAAISAAEEAKSPKAGPTGGRILAEVTPHAEFFVNKDKKVEIRFVDAANKVIVPAEQIVIVTLGDRSKPTKLVFTKDGDKLLSDKPVPEGNDYPTVVTIKADPKAKGVNVKFNLNMNKCPTCDNAEYACTCDHDKDEDKDKKAK